MADKGVAGGYRYTQRCYNEPVIAAYLCAVCPDVAADGWARFPDSKARSGFFASMDKPAR